MLLAAGIEVGEYAARVTLALSTAAPPLEGTADGAAATKAAPTLSSKSSAPPLTVLKRRGVGRRAVAAAKRSKQLAARLAIFL